MSEFVNHGLDVNQMGKQELNDLTEEVAISCQNKITPHTVGLFKPRSIISIDEIDNKASDIVNEVLTRRI